jgi:hypothetical protein
MIPTENIKVLQENKVSYLVGAQMGNLTDELITQIGKTITREDAKNNRIKTQNGYLICSYSSVFYKKDKYEMEKQIERANIFIAIPSKNKKLKFTKATVKSLY